MTPEASTLFASFLILIAALAFLMLLGYALHAANGGGWRRSFLQAAVIAGVLIVGISEGLGAIGALNAPTLGLTWILIVVGASIVCLWVRAHPGSGTVPPGQPPAGILSTKLSPGAIWCLIYMGLQAVMLAIVAGAAAPNTWDSMTYHLSRVMHWQQNQSLHFYSTAIQRQLAFGPWAEMAILQFQVLTGNDRLANFVQYFSLLGCAIGASHVAARLGAARSGQVFAGLAVLTLPMAVLQSTSTQNDLAAAFWCIVALDLVVTEEAERPSMSTSAWFGAALGLAVLTKATALVFLAPLMARYVWRVMMRWSARSVLSLVIAGVVPLLLLLPHSLRNVSLYGNPLGMARGVELDGYTNEIVGVRPLVSNAVRTMGLQLASPSEVANNALEQVIRALHDTAGIDPDDSATTWRRSRFEIVFSMYEDNAANPAHLLLILVGAALLIRAPARPVAEVWLCWLMSSLLFCLIFKWQPWSSRLILPMLVWGATLAAVQISRQLTGDRIFLPGLLLGLVALPYVLANPTRPLIGASSVLVTDRIQQYFANVPDDYRAYAQSAAMLSAAGCREVGLVSAPESREYLLWAATRAVDSQIQIEHVLVKNPSRRFESAFQPCAVVVTYPFAETTISVNGTTYAEQLKTERFHLFLVSEPPS